MIVDIETYTGSDRPQFTSVEQVLKGFEEIIIIENNRIVDSGSAFHGFLDELLRLGVNRWKAVEMLEKIEQEVGFRRR